MISRHVAVVVARFLRIVHEVTAWPVRAETDAVERAAQFGLVLRVALQITQLLHAVRELTLVTVLALSRLLVRSAELGFVSRGIYLLWQRFGLRSFQLPVTGGGGSGVASSSELVVVVAIVAANGVSTVAAGAAETHVLGQLDTVERDHLQQISHHLAGRWLGSGTEQGMMVCRPTATIIIALLLLLVLG